MRGPRHGKDVRLEISCVDAFGIKDIWESILEYEFKGLIERNGIDATRNCVKRRIM